MTASPAKPTSACHCGATLVACPRCGAPRCSECEPVTSDDCVYDFLAHAECVGSGRHPRRNAVAPEETEGAGVVEDVGISISDAAKAARITGTKPKQASGRPELTEAEIVVSGGRGAAGDFSVIETLADELGGAVGASRAAVDSGWCQHSLQIGQTGKQVSPQVCVPACDAGQAGPPTGGAAGAPSQPGSIAPRPCCAGASGGSAAAPG